MLHVGWRHFGSRAALAGALACLFTDAGFKEFGLARTDGVFAFTVAASAVLAYYAWTNARSWTWCWLMAAVATLTKGPLALILAGSGLLASVWEARSGQVLPIRRQSLRGFWIFLGLTGGWFVWSYSQFGTPLVAKMLGEELVGKAVSENHRLPGTLLYQQPLYYVGRAAPWSLLAVLGLWRVWAHPAADLTARRFERFLFCWFVLGLLVFSMAPHQRADHLWPIIPAAALLGGRELYRLTQRFRPLVFYATLSAMAGLTAAILVFYYVPLRSREPLVQATVGLRELAVAIEESDGAQFPITHVDDPMALQIFLNTLRTPVSFERAAELLRGEEPAFVAVNDIDKLCQARRSGDPPFHVLLPQPQMNSSSPTHLVSNRTELKPTDTFAFCFGTISVRVRGMRLREATQQQLSFSATEKEAWVKLVNEAQQVRHVRVRITDPVGGTHIEERLLAGKETWSLSGSGQSSSQILFQTKL
jgi:hypothetical protein